MTESNRIELRNVPPELMQALRQKATEFKYPSLKAYIINQLELSVQNQTLSEYDAETFKQVERLANQRESLMKQMKDLNKDNLKIMKSDIEVLEELDIFNDLMEFEHAGLI